MDLRILHISDTHGVHRPCLHLFGHIYKAHGTTIDGMTVFSNAAIMDEEYDSLNGPNVLPISAPEH